MSMPVDDAEASCLKTYRAQVEPRLFPAPSAHTSPVSIEDLLGRIPKSDYHCHLNGSISVALLAHMESLVAPAQTTPTSASAPAVSGTATTCKDVLATAGDGASVQGKEARMQHCFQVFDNVYKVMTNLAFTRLAVQDMLLASAAENIIVTEIRTSLRDGMTETFHRRRGGSEAGDVDPPKPGTVCTKDAYVWAVVTTVEHVLRGGRVCFDTGALIPISVSRTDAAVSRAWKTTFARVYGATQGLDLARMDTALSQMHVRLLVSVNRSGPVQSAEDAAAIAVRVQQAQVRALHEWCVTELLSSSSSSVTDSSSGLESRLAERLRSTCWVTGMDLSGNCYRGVLSGLLSTLERARRTPAVVASSPPSQAVVCPTALAMTIHAGEKMDESELSQMVAFRPERWGHLVFTDPANLARVLTDYGGIELCITSNMLTCDHEEVKDHHLTRVMQSWRALPAMPSTAAAPAPALPEGFERGASMVSLLTGDMASAVYARTAQLRRLRRLARWSPSAAQTLAQILAHPDKAAPALPNLAFHTDDRGVFETSLAHELYLAAQHPAVYFNDGMTSELRRRRRLPPALPESEVRDVVAAMWALQRLALLAVFDLPWTVWELVFLTLIKATPRSDTSGPSSVQLPRSVTGALDARQRQHEAVCGHRGERKGEDWTHWPHFVRHCAAIAPAPMSAVDGVLSTAVPVAASEVERVWLATCFDQYVLEPCSLRGCPNSAVSFFTALRHTLQGAAVSSL